MVLAVFPLVELVKVAGGVLDKTQPPRKASEKYPQISEVPPPPY